MEEKKRVRTDLGIVYVWTTKRGDHVHLAHNHLMAFTITYRKPGRTLLAKIGKEFENYDTEQVFQVFQVYYKWKRTQGVDFHLPNHSGRTKTGRPHPWRTKRFTK